MVNIEVLHNVNNVLNEKNSLNNALNMGLSQNLTNSPNINNLWNVCGRRYLVKSSVFRTQRLRAALEQVITSEYDEDLVSQPPATYRHGTCQHLPA